MKSNRIDVEAVIACGLAEGLTRKQLTEFFNILFS
jgi:hypothetical protein